MDEPLVSAGYMLLICFGITTIMQCSFFFVAYTCQFDKVTDLAGALNFITLAVLSLLLQGNDDTRAIVVTCMQVIWAIRLGSFLLIRVLKRGKDERFDEMRANSCLSVDGAESNCGWRQVASVLFARKPQKQMPATVRSDVPHLPTSAYSPLLND
ncbi:oxidoreductase-like protein [Plasmopara halstedii]|uniref:Oxidoreductase-like protein n=1 Tax=Plasmopara halstedii TaxID=4781 RepID=A0A0P1A9U1_PLAHL|nr:oxidoreductase-like protein [Plasmopara halstedii]CEG37508.1 oxidoreductase-like protein [Plasmopara halstedii]|eukprot:XP_024573877.1 oxidoreductase-like protein [Plasmopara halstedii]